MDDLFQLLHCAIKTLHMPNMQDHTLRFGEAKECASFLQRMRHRLFKQAMHAGFKEITGNAVMQRGWYSDTDHIDSIKQCMVICIRCRIVFLGYGSDAVMVAVGNTSQVDVEQLTVDT